MKKAVLVFVVAAMLLVTVGLWIANTSGDLGFTDIAGFGVIILVVAFAVFIGFKRLASAKRGEPTEDELSRKVMRKTSSLAFYISLYLWLAIMYFSEKINCETHTIIGIGILGMAVIFAVCWLILNFTGIKNE